MVVCCDCFFSLRFVSSRLAAFRCVSFRVFVCACVPLCVWCVCVRVCVRSCVRPFVRWFVYVCVS